MAGSDNEQQRLLREDTSVSDGTSTGSSPAEWTRDKSGPRLNLREKLTLVAGLLGVEASINYEQLYLLPVLQTLGMPLRLAPLTGFVSGVLGAVVVPVLGWLSDRGSNPNGRRRNGVLLSTSLMLLGISFVIVASFLHLQSPEVLGNLDDNSSFLGNTSTSVPFEARSDKSTIRLSNFTTLPNNERSFGKKANFTPTAMNTSGGNGTTGKVPFTATFAMLGFIVYEIGYDNCNSFVRSWILACSPRCEHTSLLVLGLAVAAVGGISTAALARLDFLSLLNLASKDRDCLLRLVVQISIQGTVIAAFLVLGMGSTLRSGNRLLRSIQRQTPAIRKDSDKTHNGQCSSDDNQSSIGTVASGEVTSDRKTDSIAGTAMSSLKIYGTSCSLDETVPQHREQSPGGMTGKPPDERQHQTRAKGLAREFLRKIFCICSGMFFTCGTSFMFTYFISDYVGKAVYGGDPEADVDSDELANYLTGVRTAAWGVLVYMATYLLINLVHSRILDVIGHKVEFVLVQLVTGGSMVLLAVTARLELFFLLCVVASMHRACLYSVPYAATNDVLHNETTDEEGSKRRVGMAMSIVTAMVPLAYCILYPWTGVLTEWTGAVSTPLWVGATFSCLAAGCFLFV